MAKIITFEGVDYSGKSTTFAHLAKKHAKKQDLVFNEGPIYPNELTARLFAIANQANEQEREFLYTMIFAQDAIESALNHSQDYRIFIQDRYWPIVLAYGRFLNTNKSIHNLQDFRRLFITPAATIHFCCSYEERIIRSKKRERKSVLDSLLLGDPAQFRRLEVEVERALEGLPNTLKIDTVNKNVEEVAGEIEDYLAILNLFK